MAADSSLTLRVSLFDKLGTILKNSLFKQLASLIKQLQRHLQYEPFTNDSFPNYLYHSPLFEISYLILYILSTRYKKL